ncbi:hypothetical protein DPEC_G00138390 [Dallia pectoralis]|uniref:Uncharacterized protein n=1 Tax=Dallia pectoralis TaxID=75939 RepID=A0ACC2GLZ1_DALPE|nr:hypothetical protein DPEC_G00138390 [Dallia pectoralis]
MTLRSAAIAFKHLPVGPTRGGENWRERKNNSTDRDAARWRTGENAGEHWPGKSRALVFLPGDTGPGPNKSPVPPTQSSSLTRTMGPPATEIPLPPTGTASARHRGWLCSPATEDVPRKKEKSKHVSIQRERNSRLAIVSQSLLRNVK